MVKTSKNFKFFALILLASTLLIVAVTPAISTVKAQSTDSIVVFVAVGGSISANGTALPSGGSTQTYANGAVVSFNAIAGTGFTFLAWETATAAGGNTSTTNPFVWTISGSGELQAIFIPTSNVTSTSSSGSSTIGVYSSIGGSTSPKAGTYTTYTIGTVSAFTATPGSGFNFLCWEVATAAGSFTTTSNPLEYNVSANNCGIQAIFVPTGSSVTLPTPAPSSTPKVSEFSSATVAIMAVILAVAAFGTYAYTKRSKN